MSKPFWIVPASIAVAHTIAFPLAFILDLGLAVGVPETAADMTATWPVVHATASIIATVWGVVLPW